ncbi:amino acid/amide ABC transporter membrane protein 1, HAAT family [Salinihabitans flavidus]|uniref:Amino acid/amide ABC transporter membrane protein 1, HAAT family n=1 Tax=Salinihabitans flavidus TaxID=569882 RepID=A0A1H8PJL7_9RHOB|nr:branched-chain amino acid ABC transporter permease [Salinihabitans flavidus]SEO42219.1 amino acid/amide ABC transporter membrane protein 1, HAAT family [Salinihabitans flavidus]
MDFFLLLISTGLVIGASYGLIAMGFALVYKATGVVNFAHGELVMLTAYIAFSLTQIFGLSFIPLMLVTIPISMVLGLTLERIFIRPMLGEPVFSIVMVTIGLAVILRGVTIMIWGPDPHNLTAGVTRDVIRVFGIPFYAAQLMSIAALAICTTLGWAFLRFSRIGISMRAVASHETAALLVGISVSRTHAMAWALSSGLAAVAGVLFAMNFKLAPDLWFQGLKSFPAVILGGLDSILGAAFAGVIIGLIENLSQGYIGQGLREISGFIVIIIVLMVRPYGLFGDRDIERV